MAIVPGTRADWWGGYHDSVRMAEEAEGRALALDVATDQHRGLLRIGDCAAKTYIRLPDPGAATGLSTVVGFGAGGLADLTVRLVGEQVDETRYRRYFDRVVDVLRLAGSRVVVLGSGWTRNVPEGWRVQREGTSASPSLACSGWRNPSTFHRPVRPTQEQTTQP